MWEVIDQSTYFSAYCEHEVKCHIFLTILQIISHQDSKYQNCQLQQCTTSSTDAKTAGQKQGKAIIKIDHKINKYHYYKTTN